MPLTVILDSLDDVRDYWLNGTVGFIARITTDSNGVISFSVIYRRPIETGRRIEFAWLRWFIDAVVVYLRRLVN